MWLFPLGAASVSLAFSLVLTRTWLDRRRPHLLCWALALAMFSAASLAAAGGILGDWTPSWFGTYYYLGAVANVPVLALGTIYLLAPRRVAHAVAVVTTVALGAALIVAWRVDLVSAGLATAGIPRGADVVPGSLRLLSRYYSFAGFIVVLGGALWSAARLARSRDPELRRLVIANVLIALGTFVVAVASGFARYGRGSVFGIGLLAGVSLMFAGFLTTRPARGSNRVA